MNSEVAHPPRTIMEVYKMLPEGTMAELINGQIFMSPAPSNQHQRILKKIFRALDDLITKNNLGEVFISPSDVYLDQISNAVQPDIYFISSENKMIISDTKPNEGVPDLIVEIVSPSNDAYDYVTKKNLYENFGVKEYWIVDPTSKEATVYLLQNNLYQLTGKEVGKAYSGLLDHSFEF